MDNNEQKAVNTGEAAAVKIKKKKTGKEIAMLVLNIVIWVFVAFAIAVTIIIFASFGNDDGIPSFGKTMWVSVQSESMTGIFNKGDLIFAQKLTEEEKTALKVDDIVTFYSAEDINGNGQLDDMNSHRIIRVEGEGSTLQYITKGDNNLIEDKDPLRPGNIIAQYNGGKLPGVGGMIDFLNTQLGFGIFVVLPVIALFVYYLVNFIMLIKPKKKALTADEEEEIKQRAIEEYLRQQQEGAAEKTEAVAEKVTDNKSSDNDNGASAE